MPAAALLERMNTRDHSGATYGRNAAGAGDKGNELVCDMEIKGFAPSREPLRRFVDAMPYMVLLVNGRGEITYRNQAWFSYTGLTLEQSRGDDWLALLHADDRQRRSACWMSALSADAPFSMELRMRPAADAIFRSFLLNVAPVRDDTGKIDYWLESYVDVNDFRVSREFCEVLDHLGHMVAVRNADESLAFVSPSWVRFSGGVAASSPTRERREFVHPDDVRLVEDIVNASHAAPLQIQQNEVRVRSQDGSYRWFLARSIVLLETPETPKRRLNTLTDIEDLKRAQAKLAASAAELFYKANHDPLTDLLNRRGFVDRLSQLLDEANITQTRVLVCYLDVDHFKSINDVLGHDAGDVLLKVLATRIYGALRSADIASRFGGDEFILACPIVDVADVTQIVERLQAAITEPLEVAGRTMTVSCSIGAGIFPDGCTRAGELIEQADIAMYEVKRGGRGAWRLYVPG